ncbi:MAG: hypothetical protein C1943_00120 [Halochromatium sp.]|nr:hypothetical protein [Halochromatium sp.]
MRFLVCLLFLLYPFSLVADQSCRTDELPLSLPTARFVSNDDATLTDTATDLMWQRCAWGQEWTGSGCKGQASLMTWPEALQLADATNADGTLFYNDWRLPNIRDLATIVERQCQDPRTNLELFPDTPAHFFWTSTTRSGDESTLGAYALSFGPEGVEHRSQSERYPVRLVRPAP